MPAGILSNFDNFNVIIAVTNKEKCQRKEKEL
jgi:hypothetical protein